MKNTFSSRLDEFRRNFGQEPSAEPRRFHGDIFDGAHMADNSGGGGASSVLALLLGGLIVAVVVLGFFMFNGRMGNGAPNVPSHITMNVKTPAAPTHP
jgi:hypothetical protein